jgi:hypothetical protein
MVLTQHRKIKESAYDSWSDYYVNEYTAGQEAAEHLDNMIAMMISAKYN